MCCVAVHAIFFCHGVSWHTMSCCAVLFIVVDYHCVVRCVVSRCRVCVVYRVMTCCVALLCCVLLYCVWWCCVVVCIVLVLFGVFDCANVVCVRFYALLYDALLGVVCVVVCCVVVFHGIM